MITKKALAEARARGAQAALSHYGLNKTAAGAAAGGILNTLGAAGSRALTSGTKAYTHGGGNMAQNAWRGLQGAAKGFHRGGGTGAAAKAVGVGAAGLGATYAAGRGFGAGMRDAQANNAPTGGVKLNGLREDLIGGEISPGREALGLGTSLALGALPHIVTPLAFPAHAVQGALRGKRHGDAVDGGIRGFAGSTGGYIAATLGLNALRRGTHVPEPTANVVRTLGSGLGAHLLTRKYLADPKKPAPPALPETDEIRLTDPIDMSGAPGTKISGIREELIGGKFDPGVDIPGLAASYLSTHVEHGVPLHGVIRGGISADGTMLGGALRSTVGGATGGVLARYLARRLGGSRFSPLTETATRLGTAAGSHLLTRKYLTEPDEE